MYEDVVKELRNLLRSYKATDNGNCHQAKILASAADAIDTLRAMLEDAPTIIEAEVDDEHID